MKEPNSMNKDREPENLHNENLERIIRSLEKNAAQEQIARLIATLKERMEDGGEFLIPVMDPEDFEEGESDLFQPRKLSLSSVFEPEKVRQAFPRKVELSRGGKAFSAFTSRKELDKGEGTKFTTMDIRDFFEMAYEDPDCIGVVLNPWDISVLLDKQVLELVLMPAGENEKKSRIFIDKGDITRMDTDAIVNAANTALMPGGGVCGAIFQAAGMDELEKACEKLGGCAIGKAKITPGFHLPARYIIHTVGPIYGMEKEEEKLLASCYTSSLDLAKEQNLHSIAFPAISTGIYGYPPELAIPIAIETVSFWIHQHPDYPMEVTLVSFDEKTYQMYLDYARNRKMNRNEE